MKNDKFAIFDAQKSPPANRWDGETLTLDSSRGVPEEPAAMRPEATRQDCVKALFTFVEIFANSTDEAFDATQKR
jgi:hypothetical protein